MRMYTVSVVKNVLRPLELHTSEVVLSLGNLKTSKMGAGRRDEVGSIQDMIYHSL